ncbi:MAG: glycosyltransferase [Isosphaeraceae bacterium]
MTSSAPLKAGPATGLAGLMSNQQPAPAGRSRPLHATWTPRTSVRRRLGGIGTWAVGWRCPSVGFACSASAVRRRRPGRAVRPGLFDDDDYYLRARKAGFGAAVAADPSAPLRRLSLPFAEAGLDSNALLAENAARFAAKWGDEAPRGRPVTLPSWSPTPGAPPASGRPRISLTMIVKNEEANLPACLESAEGLFDEVIVVDTGSQDRTRELALERGAKVSEFPWVDDFAAARNFALEQATGDYAFWLDADDVIEPAERAKLVHLLGDLRAGDDAAYVVRCSCDPDADGGGGQTVVDHVRLFPLRPGVRWEYRVHEQILPALRRAGIPVRWSDVVVRHTGYSDPATRLRKLDRDEAILRAELETRPGDPFVLFNLGSIALERRDWAGALGPLRASLASSSPTDSIVRKLHALIARCHQQMGDLPSALAACDVGLASEPDDAELLFRKAVLLHSRRNHAAAESLWRRILTLRRPERFSSVDMGIYGHLTRRNLAVLAEARGDRAEASRLWREVARECPGDPEAASMLARLDAAGAPAP